MSFAMLSWPVVAAGAAALAALLYLLQRLRARRRVVALATAMLWAQALEDAPLRVAGARFRYWLAYLLALAIALALWLAFAHPVPPARGAATGQELFYLDASAALGGAGEWDAATRALLADVRAAPGDRRAVFLGDATGTRLLAPGEAVPLLARRLAGLTATARPSTFAAWLRDRAARSPGAVVRYYGAWPVARGAAQGLPVTLTYGHLSRPVPGNRGIVALGAMPAASGRWGRADVLVEAPGVNGAAALRFTRDGRADSLAVSALAPGRFLLRDVVADGTTLAVELRDGDGFAMDDRAALRLPDRRPVRVAIGAGVPGAIAAAVRADDAFAVTDPAQAQVVVALAGQAPADRPALVLGGSEGAAFAFAGPGEGTGGDLAKRVDDFGLARVDAVALADALRRPIGVSVADAPVRRLTVWRELFDPRAGFARSAAAPLFVARGLRWLAGDEPWRPYVRAGADLPGPVAGWSGAGVLPGTPAFLDRAGETNIDGRPQTVSLLDPATTRMMADPASPPAISPGGATTLPDPWFMGLIALALLLLGAEWVLVRRGWMP